LKSNYTQHCRTPRR